MVSPRFVIRSLPVAGNGEQTDEVVKSKGRVAFPGLLCLLFAVCIGCGDNISGSGTNEVATTGVVENEALSKSHDRNSPVEDPTSYVRLKVRRSSDKNFLTVDVEAKSEPKIERFNTVAFFTLDVFYDDRELDFLTSQRGVLPAGYVGNVKATYGDGRNVVRTDYYSYAIGYSFPGYSLGKSWALVERLHFAIVDENQKPRLAVRNRTLTIGYYDSPGNSNGRSTFYYSSVVVK